MLFLDPMGVCLPMQKADGEKGLHVHNTLIGERSKRPVNVNVNVFSFLDELLTDLSLG